MRFLKPTLAVVALLTCVGFVLGEALLVSRALSANPALPLRTAYVVMLAMVVYSFGGGVRWLFRVASVTVLFVCCCALQYGNFGLSAVGLSYLLVWTCCLVLLLCPVRPLLHFLSAHYRGVLARLRE